LLIINEVGQVGVDHELLRQESSEPILLAGGCVCCTLRENLVFTLRDMWTRQQRGEIAPFERVVVETTGLADPRPLVRALLTDIWAKPRFSVGTVTTVVEATRGGAVLEQYDEAVAQIVMADRLVVTKADLATVDELDGLSGRLRACGAVVPVEFASDVLRAKSLFAKKTAASLDLACWLMPRDGSDERHHGHRVQIQTIEVDQALKWRILALRLDNFLAQNGKDVLRLKGVVKTSDLDHPVALQAVHNSFYPPTPLVQTVPVQLLNRLTLIGTKDLQPMSLSHLLDVST